LTLEAPWPSAEHILLAETISIWRWLILWRRVCPKTTASMLSIAALWNHCRAGKETLLDPESKAKNIVRSSAKARVWSAGPIKRR